jgi:predicted Zn-dependent peptidase
MIKKVDNNLGINAFQIRIKSGDAIFVKCVFKKAGVLHNDTGKHGISVVLSHLLCRKIGNLSVEETKEKLLLLGISDFSIDASADDLILSFFVLKDKATDAFMFLSSVFQEPPFKKNDLEFIKEMLPVINDPETSDPYELLLSKLLSLLYPYHNYGLNVTGTLQDISSITEEDVRFFIKDALSVDNLEVFFSGDITQHEVALYTKTLFSKLSRINTKIEYQSSLSGESNEVSDIICQNSMKDITGIMCGVRLDGLTKIEQAAAYIILETVFGRENGDFSRGLREKNITYAARYNLLKRKFSSVFYLWVFVNKENVETYIKYLEEKFSTCSNKLNSDELKFTQNRLIEQSNNGFSDILDIESKIVPFSKVTSKILTEVTKRLFDKSKRRTVFIHSCEQKRLDCR